VRVFPDFAAGHNSLGIALASLGRLDQAAEQFQLAVQLDPTFVEARRNLQAAQQRRR
jgi:Flp pilus assembly protein TadD